MFIFYRININYSMIVIMNSIKNIISYCFIIFIMFLYFDYSVVRITTLTNSTININNLYATDIPIITMISNNMISTNLTMY